MKSDTKPTVQVKSMRDGLLFLLDEQCELESLLEGIEGLLFGETQTVFDGPDIRIAIDYGRRSMTAVESSQILSIFLRRENFLLTEWGPNTDARRQVIQARTRFSGTQHIYKGTVRAGQRLVFEGDVVVIGDVNPGGEVVATGDIFVFGKLSGIAHSGAAGDQQSVIAAAEFVPMQLRIASIVSRAPDGRERDKTLQTFMEFAYIRDNGMAVDKMQYLTATRQKSQASVDSEGEIR